MGTRGFSCAVSGVGYVSIVSRLRHSLIGLRPASHEARRENTSGTQGNTELDELLKSIMALTPRAGESGQYKTRTADYGLVIKHGPGIKQGLRIMDSV